MPGWRTILRRLQQLAAQRFCLVVLPRLSECRRTLECCRVQALIFVHSGVHSMPGPQRPYYNSRRGERDPANPALFIGQFQAAVF
jgi:hypothetical protein